MKSNRLLLITVALVLCMPVLVHADASVHQDSCVVVGPDQVRVYFTVFNLDLPRSICSFEVVAKDDTQAPQCEAVDCGPAQNWRCSLNTHGGAGFGALPADPAGTNCLAPGTALGGFYITINPGFCCYRILYADDSGTEFLQSYVCFTLCEDLPVEQRTWGHIKSLYDE